MGAFLARRSVRMLVILLIASVAVFYGLRVAPGDPTGAVLSPMALESAREAYRERLGLNQPILAQYATYVRNLFQGNLGTSLVTGKPIGELLAIYGRNSLILGAAALLLTYAVGIPLGVLAAAKRGSWVDTLASGLAVVGLGMPNFWLALLLIVLFSSRLRWLPSAGCCSPKHLILPAIVLAAEGMAVTTRLMRSSMLEQLGQDYVRTHRAKGLAERVVVGSRAFRNALLPQITALALSVGMIFNGALLTEMLFSYPGLGALMRSAVANADYNLLYGTISVTIIAVATAALVIDLAYPLFDPRIRYR